jgi:hypothetical protein
MSVLRGTMYPDILPTIDTWQTFMECLSDALSKPHLVNDEERLTPTNPCVPSFDKCWHSANLPSLLNSTSTSLDKPCDPQATKYLDYTACCHAAATLDASMSIVWVSTCWVTCIENKENCPTWIAKINPWLCNNGIRFRSNSPSKVRKGSVMTLVRVIPATRHIPS